jgi:hypothetical protein
MHLFFAKKRNEHTWFGRKETGGDADLLCCLCSLLHRSVSLPLLFCCGLLVRPCFVFFKLFSLVFPSVSCLFCSLSSYFPLSFPPSSRLLSVFYRFFTFSPLFCLFPYLSLCFLSLSLHLLSVFSPSFLLIFQSSSPAFICQRRPCAGKWSRSPCNLETTG